MMTTDIAPSAPPRPTRGSSKNAGNGTSGAMAVEHAVASSWRRGADTLERRTAPGASFDSGTKYDPPKCHPRTRSAIFLMIKNWLHDERRDCGMLWMYGPNSVGKSSIAQTISHMCAEEGLLAASFFFSRSVAGLNTEKHLMATLAHQISLSIPETRRYIAQAVESDTSVFSGSLETQLQTLIVNPLLQAYSTLGDKRPGKQWARLVVIDGLDECQNANVQRYIVRILSTALIHRKLPLFILVASRPEAPIRDSFNSYDLREMIYTIVLDESYMSDAEIRRYLWSKFEQIRQSHPLRTYIPHDWPSQQTMQNLVQRTSGQFIYATTVMKYVDSAQHRPVERLEAVLRIVNPLGDIPFAELDCLYRHILASAHNIKGVLRILGALLCSQKLYSRKDALGKLELPIPVADPRFLEELLSLNRGDVPFILTDLHAILNVPDARRNTIAQPSNAKVSEQGLRILHHSLSDFLTDRSRAGRYFINAVKVHAELARCCVRNILSGHKFVHQYAGQALVTHCRLSVLTHELLTDLSNLDLSVWVTTCKTWNDGGGPFEQIWIELPYLFNWFQTLTYPDPRKNLHALHMRSWDAYLQKEVQNYFANDFLIDLLTFVTYPGLLWDWIHVWPLLCIPLSETNEKEAIDRGSLHLMGLKSIYDPYRRMLSQFLTDRDRSGRYQLKSEHYTQVALRMAKYLFEPKKPGNIFEYRLPREWTWYREGHEDKMFREKRAKETFQAGLQYLPFFLGEAMADEDLIAYLKTNKLDIIRAKELPRLAWADDKTKLEKAVEDYLARWDTRMDVVNDHPS